MEQTRSDSLMEWLYAAIVPQLTSQDKEHNCSVHVLPLNTDWFMETDVWDAADVNTLCGKFELDVSRLVGKVARGSIASHRKYVGMHRAVAARCMVRNIHYMFPDIRPRPRGVPAPRAHTAYSVVVFMRPKIIETVSGTRFHVRLAYYIVCEIRVYAVNLMC